MDLSEKVIFEQEQQEVRELAKWICSRHWEELMPSPKREPLSVVEARDTGRVENWYGHACPVRTDALS